MPIQYKLDRICTRICTRTGVTDGKADDGIGRGGVEEARPAPRRRWAVSADYARRVAAPGSSGTCTSVSPTAWGWAAAPSPTPAPRLRLPGPCSTTNQDPLAKAKADRLGQGRRSSPPPPPSSRRRPSSSTTTSPAGKMPSTLRNGPRRSKPMSIRSSATSRWRTSTRRWCSRC